MYQQLQHQSADSPLLKIRRSLYLIVSITLLTHTISITYSIMSFRQQSVGFISIIVSSLVCFFVSSSHLTIYGISILGCLYLSMLRPYYHMRQLCYIVALSGVVNFVLWKGLHQVGGIFRCLPGRVHASMVFGVALIVLTKFFPLAIQNIQAFFLATDQSPLTNPLEIVTITFSTFNIITLGLTTFCIFLMILLRNRLEKIPFIALLVLIGIALNWTKIFASFQDLCAYAGPNNDHSIKVDCTFYILNFNNLIRPKLQQLIEVIPASMVMSVVLVFEQFLYLEQFQRRGKRYKGEGNLGDVKTQSKVLAIANIISGCLGGLPVCISMFGTYENFAFNQKYGFKGTKLVGLMQIPVSYCLYSFLSFFYQRIPLFILFTIVATPVIYFLRNMLTKHSNNLFIIIFIATLNVITHPVIALIFAAIFSIYDIAQLLKPSPAELIVENVYVAGQRQSAMFAKVVQKNENNLPGNIMANIVGNNNNYEMNQFVSHIKQIEDDIPQELEDKAYILYRFVGTISYLNFFQNHNQIKKISQKYCNNSESHALLALSFRYAQVIDQQSLQQLSYLVQQLRNNGTKVILTGLHAGIIVKMKDVKYFKEMLLEEQGSMFALHVE